MRSLITAVAFLAVFSVCHHAVAEPMELYDHGHVYDDKFNNGKGSGAVHEGSIQTGYDADADQLQKGVVNFGLDATQYGVPVASATLSIYLQSKPASDIGDLLIEHRSGLNNKDLQKQDYEHEDYSAADYNYTLSHADDAAGQWYHFDVTDWIQTDYDTVSNPNQLGTSFRFVVDAPVTDASGQPLYSTTQLYQLGIGPDASYLPILDVVFGDGGGMIPEPASLLGLGVLGLTGLGLVRPRRQERQELA